MTDGISTTRTAAKHLSLRSLVALFVIGAVISPFGDYCHVITRTTVYASSPIPFILGVPVWFPLLVGMATVAIGVLRVRVLPGPDAVQLRAGVLAVAVLMAQYSISALLITSQSVPATILMLMLSVITWHLFGDAAAVVCGLAAALVGTVAEIVMVHWRFFIYTDDSLFGVAPWLPALYFSFGVVAALLGQMAAKPVPSMAQVSRREPTETSTS
ncbi:hypothetical protein [Mycobacteroides salmoniphilum]|uniref:hypothetical protein n=1 Tax=Mycobacteroides salmoniphilum TaxID=404941 RepID=UPI0012FFB981|nr:hypothetical protein [Mycobacteroides salmoniphilum]